MDPTRTNETYAALAYLHPALAALGLLLALVVLSAGLRMRDARLKRRPSSAAAARRHVRWAPFTAWVLVGAFVLGPVSSLVLRDWKLLGTFHGWAGLVAVACFSAAALLGRKLRVTPGPQRSVHGNLGLLGMLAGAVAAITGIELLP